jgi:N-hydroxyarylamine O-acetyltransferase
MNVARYLDRIGYTGSIEPSSETLRCIHRAHMLAVPFENLDITRRRRVSLEPEASVRKIVEERRGGFCYELNGAFAALLEALGFKVTLLSARVARANGDFSPEFDHLTLKVDLDQPWLADVGFGELFLEPLLLTPGLEQPQAGNRFRITQGEERLLLEKAALETPWRPEYGFSLQPRLIEDFAEMCEFHQTSPESSFTLKSVCSIATADGRITISEMKLIVTRNGEREEREIASEQERSELLRDRFGVVLK